MMTARVTLDVIPTTRANIIRMGEIRKKRNFRGTLKRDAIAISIPIKNPTCNPETARMWTVPELINWSLISLFMPILSPRTMARASSASSPLIYLLISPRMKPLAGSTSERITLMPWS